MTYNKLNYQTPDALKNRHMGKKFLIIGSGTSTRHIIPFKNKIRDKFDVIVGINLSTLEFEECMDYHIIVEKNPQVIYGPMMDGTHNYRTDLPRILNWKAIDKFPKDIRIYKTTRNRFGGKADIRKYKYSGKEGLLIGPPDSKGLSAGTASMQALHLSAIMGAREIYLIGTDLMFKDEFDHFYPDNWYRKSKTKIANKSPIVKIIHNGKEYDSTEYFRESAKFFDHVIKTYCKKCGISVYDFSGGLIKEAIKMDIKKFFG